jgi:thiol-disulfide isomerase/thioredoxin
MKSRHYIYSSITSLLLFIGLSALGGYPGHDVKFMAVTYLILFKVIEKKVAYILILILLAPSILIDLPIHVLDFQLTRMSLPSSMANLIGIAFGLLIHFSKIFLKIILTAILLSFSIWMAVTGYDFWLHKLSFGTYTGKVNYKVEKQIEGFDQLNNQITSDALSGKIVVLDFWHTHCGICFSEFPKIQQIYDQYRSNPDVMVIAVNKPLRADTIGQAFQMLADRRYTFPVLIPVDTNLAEAFGVQAYPTVCILNKERAVVFRGSADKAENALEALLMEVPIKF